MLYKVSILTYRVYSGDCSLYEFEGSLVLLVKVRVRVRAVNDTIRYDTLF